MKVVVGLGNPGKKYEKTRHNIGFMAIDELANQLQAPPMQTKFNGLFTTVHTPAGKVILVKPLTYMNLSGDCVRPLLDYFSVDLEDLVVLYDDMDFAPGTIKLRQKGSAGGHNGMKSIIQHVGTTEFNRIRMGIGRPAEGVKVVDYVLTNFSKAEQPLIEEAVYQTAQACQAWLKASFNDVMNEYNG